MRERIAAAYGQSAAKVFISNFHGLCGTILRRMGSPLGYTERMTVCDSDDQVDLILQIARKRGMEPTKPQARILAMIVNDVARELSGDSDIEAAANGRSQRTGGRVARPSTSKILRARNQCDFSGLLSETVRLLRERATSASGCRTSSASSRWTSTRTRIVPRTRSSSCWPAPKTTCWRSAMPTR